MKANAATAVACLASAITLAATTAHASYLCKDAKAGDYEDVSGSLVRQTDTSYVLEQPDGGYLIQVVGLSNGEKVDSYLYINEATRVKMQRCHKNTALSFRVKCKERGEPEVITLVC